METVPINGLLARVTRAEKDIEALDAKYDGIMEGMFKISGDLREAIYQVKEIQHRQDRHYDNNQREKGFKFTRWQIIVSIIVVIIMMGTFIIALITALTNA